MVNPSSKSGWLLPTEFFKSMVIATHFKTCIYSTGDYQETVIICKDFKIVTDTIGWVLHTDSLLE